MDLSAVRILVVDDNRQSRELVKSVLASVGARDIHEASTADEAIACLGKAPIDFVILDQHLRAGGEGLALARRIRNDPASPSPFVSILMLTGHADERLVIAARDAGVSEFMAKPFTAAGLLRRVEVLILQPRVFVRSPDYVGPDRRRRSDGRHAGVDRRRRT